MSARRGVGREAQLPPHRSPKANHTKWTRLQPIRTAAEVALEFAVFTHEPFVYQQIGPDVWKMRKLGMTLQAIGHVLGVDEKTVRNILRRG
jgi:hypothetical protein